MMNDLKEDVVIVGAGPIGLLLGCWLRKLGVGVRIIEKRMTRSTQSKATSMNAYLLATKTPHARQLPASVFEIQSYSLLRATQNRSLVRISFFSGWRNIRAWC